MNELDRIYNEDCLAGMQKLTTTGWYIDPCKLSLDMSGCLKVYQIDNKVIAERDGKKGVARCNPTATFDFLTGAKLAIERLEATVEAIKKGGAAK